MASVAHIVSYDSGTGTTIPSRRRRSDTDKATQVVTQEILDFLLHEEGIEYNGFTPSSDEPQLAKTVETLKALSRNMLVEYGAEMRQLCFSLDLSDEQFYGTYCAVAENTLGSDIRWGRIVSLMTFTGLLAAFLMRTGQKRKVESLLGWEREFISSRCHAWIEEHGGWVSVHMHAEAPYSGFFKRRQGSVEC